MTNAKQNNQTVKRQRVIYLHDSTCEGLHEFRGGYWLNDIFHDTTTWACWECGKPLGTLDIPRYPRTDRRERLG